MADKKVTQLTSLTTPVSADLLLIIDDAGGTPVSKQITVKNLAGALPNTSVSTLTTSANTTLAGSNTVISSNLNFTSTRAPQISATAIKLAPTTGAVSNNATTQLGGGQQGAIFVDDEYIYVATSNTVVKRVALSVFSS
jgi:hypothetical protein|tara:strand:- start:1274 stop:1690 length:417 start_codon:yes stop_codon:yes gene_type:complete